MTGRPLDEEYFVWLYGQVGSIRNRNRSKTYWKLLRMMHEKQFAWSRNIERDENRAQDGKDLRREFLRSTNTSVGHIDDGWMDLECSILELLVALSRKLAFEGEGEPAEWFWGMIENLGLSECTDAYPPDQSIINRILDRVINRDYADNGVGGLFPLQRTTDDQRYVELWYQAQAYLLERL